MRRPLAVAALAALAAGAVGGPAASAASGSGDFRITDSRVTESSGLALSRRHPHTVWTTNDSGDTGRIFAIDAGTGRTVGVHTFDAPVQDVEALAITPQGRVLVGDIGDNTGSRDLVRIFWFDEPDLGTTSGSWASWELRYPDGPHDAESLAVDPRTGRVVIVTKSGDGAVYQLPAQPSRRGVNRLTRVGAAPSGATDAVYTADGSALLVRTYLRLFALDPSTWTQRSSRLLPLQPQGESLALAPDGRGLLVGSEGLRSWVLRVDSPVRPDPPTSASSTPAGPATARAGAAPDGDGPSTPWWLARAGGVLVLLGVVLLIGLRHRRRAG